MASNYGPHFGVRRLDDDNATREGRYKTPATGNRLVLGTAVEMDFAAAGYMKQSPNASPLKTGVSGLLIYEDQFLAFGPFGTINAPVRYDTTYMAYAQLGRFAVITSGAGIKVWFTSVRAAFCSGTTSGGTALNGPPWARRAVHNPSARGCRWCRSMTLRPRSKQL
jgi:hypothetical protein